MNIGDSVVVPDGRTAILVRLENGVATVLFQFPNQPMQVAFNQADVKPVFE